MAQEYSPQHPINNAVVMTAKELARYLKISTRTLWRMRSAGQLPLPVKLGGTIRWQVEAIQKWLSDGCPANAQRDNGTGRNK